ncbi:proton-conducting transporter transmembrane domain-containing protein [Coxiella burnetii]|uniref:proton-conducting transporter transmembrane domain-containing protein n=1 Tax=Coxiella burnetii TaxID=777 RepID=UPI000183CE30|nr:proton-conducting transporter membrane subunit [Coxiella burnetii]ACJ17854.1 sodium/proton antiporter protein [Coxiella burnetii CbuG_Q212]ATN66286.1 NADH/ubiquinone/plastoquinone [Coxiella burnetii]OYK86759.1 Na+/H+ antiporter subunit D [Coxiella burnetii]
MKLLPILPLLICLITAILCCFFWSFERLQKICHLTGAIVLLMAVIVIFIFVTQKGILVMQMGDYLAPFGISIVIDLLSAIMLVVTGLIALCVAIYALSDIKSTQQNLGFYPVYWILLVGICGAFSTGDMFNLYVWFEVMLIASFVLMALGNERIQLDGTIKYVAMNLIATILMLTAIAMLYGIVGTLNMADLSVRLSHYPNASIVMAAALLLAIAFSIKTALFPLFFWLPASYHTTSVSASAIFAGMLTKVGVYTLIRLVTLIVPNNQIILGLLLASSGLTMLTGVLGAASQYNFRRILSFHIISQIGYMVMGLSIRTPLALASAVFYIVHHIIVKTNLFLISGVTNRLGKSFDIRALSGFYRQSPLLAILFFIPAFSLAGFPPLSGFWAKLSLLQAAFTNHNYIIAAIALIVSFLTLYSMIKIWNQVFWTDKSQSKKEDHALLSTGEKFSLFVPVILLVSITLAIAFFPQLFFQVMSKASSQLLDSSQYVRAVLGDRQ